MTKTVRSRLSNHSPLPPLPFPSLPASFPSLPLCFPLPSFPALPSLPSLFFHFFHPSLCLVALPVTSWNKYQAGRESCSMPSLKSERVLLCKASLTMKSMKWVQLRQLLKASGCLFLPLVLRIFCQSLGFFSPWPRLKRHPVHDTTWRPLIVEKFQFKTLCFISKPKHQNPTSPPTLMLRPPSRVRNFRISRKRRSWQTWPWGASPRQVNYKCICLYSKNINILLYI